MEYQKIINLLDNTSNQPSKFRTRNWVEINDDASGRYDKKVLSLKLQCSMQIYMIIVIPIYF